MFRIGVVRLLGPMSQPTLKNTDINHVRTLTRMSSQKLLDEIEPRAPKPAPFDYKNKPFGWWNYFLEGTTKRFDARTKLIVVEGSVASGKTAMAKMLAEQFDFEYFPEANLDMVNINSYGYDLRKLDPQLPESCRSFDVNNFLMNPNSRKTARFQIEQFRVKFHQYIDALVHLLSTGHGVVLDRCVYSDFVFLEAMFKQKYISKEARKYYYDIRDYSMFTLLRPHLLVYVDVSVPKILDNIKKRNVAYEANSKVLSPNYLKSIEQQYKEKFLPEMSKHSEVLIYDWSEGGDTDAVVDDIEAIDFERYDKRQTIFKDWDQDDADFNELRHHFTSYKYGLLANTALPIHHVPELMIDPIEVRTADAIIESAPGEEFAKGYNTKMGDRSIYLRPKYDNMLLPKIERRTTFPTNV